ncbi:N-acetylmuramoyl-L-alanine amidase family protein [Anaeromicropila populeti]|uniref:N-acetylmuramoyl-L-alanine amidase n=1 Tax=Anaeromicropila populeti TaxID=37658 RepID=A0A1I6I7X4_9FIRM|nr:N-acetylmuramoyl-L-alanine amidase [Anaeromicropila populeti]SFR62759.1 N-acetylmuramoyl-L-alanine amidase [Anaeromicropila populeti]
MKKYCYITIIIVILLIVYVTMKKGNKILEEDNTVVTESPVAATIEPEGEKIRIVVDAGHGGFDPGKVGVNGVLEKDVNLDIALKLNKLLDENNFDVKMIRTQDNGLYDETDTNKKRVDLSRRVQIVNNSGARLAVSIHQNSFQQESSKGAQVFYHTASEEGKKLAQFIQETLKAKMADGNHRMAKSNDTYYMLKKTQCPLVIVECCFLSNRQEAEFIKEEEYQQKIAEAIFEGIQKYLSETT